MTRAVVRQTVTAEQLKALWSAADPLSYQRRAARWLDQLLERASDALPRLADGTPLQPFESLRAQVIQVGGRALADLEVAERLCDRFAGSKVCLDGPDARRIARVARIAGLGFIEAPLLSTLRAYARERGYRARRDLKRLARGANHGVADDREWFALAVPRMPDHLADLLPVVKLLSAEGRQTLFATDALAEQLRREGFPVVDPSLASRRDQLALGLGIGRRALKLSRDGGAATTAADRVMAETVRTLLLEHAFVLGSLALGVNRLLTRAHPRVVIVGNPYTMEGRVACMLAGRHGIPSVCIEHGTIFANDPIWERSPVSQMLVRGEPSRRTLGEYGLTGDRVAIVGAPRLDAYTARAPGDRPRAVLVASSGGGDQVSMAEHRHFIALLYQAAEQTPDIPWVVKLHPKDSPDLYLPVARQHPWARVEVRPAVRARTGVEIYDYLDRCRVLVTVISTTALDAMAVGVPVVSVLVDEQTTRARSARIDFLAQRTVTRVRTAAELAHAVTRKIEQGPDEDVDARAQVYAARLFHHRGDSAKQAAEAIIRLAARGAGRG